MKNAVIYARYSSEKQNEQSIEGQLRVCEDYAQRNEIQIIKTYIDRAQSGTTDNRKNFQKMLRESANGKWEYILVYKLDRFSRNKYEMAIHRKFLKDHGVKILSAMENIPDTPEGIILESLLEGMAEYYSAELSQKVKRGNKENRLKGLYTGGPVPLGYKVINKKVYVDEEAAPAVVKMFEDYIAGKGLTEIAEYLNAAGHAKGRRKPFTNSTIYNMIHNEKYIGITRYNDEIYPEIFPPIISSALFKAAQEKAEMFKYGKGPADPNNIFLLRNKAVCGLCGHSYVTESGAGKNHIVCRYYKCLLRKKKHLCSNIILRKEVLEKFVIDITFKIFMEADGFEEIVDKIYKLHQQRMTSNGLLNILLGQKEILTTSIANLVDYATKGVMTKEIEGRIKELKTQLVDVEKQIKDINAKTTTHITRDDVSKFLRTVLKDDSHTLLQLLINKVIIYPNKVEIYYNYVEKDLREKNPTNPIVLLTEKEEYIKNNTRFGTPADVVKINVIGCI